jgi:hypothetical protein
MAAYGRHSGDLQAPAQPSQLFFFLQVEVAGGWRRMAATVGISYRLQLNHLNYFSSFRLR